MVSFPQVSSPEPCTHLSPHPHVPHAPPISFFSILPPAQYWVRSTDQPNNDKSIKLRYFYVFRGADRLWELLYPWFLSFLLYIPCLFFLYCIISCLSTFSVLISIFVSLFRFLSIYFGSILHTLFSLCFCQHFVSFDLIIYSDGYYSMWVVVSFLVAVKRPLHISVEFLQRPGHFTVHCFQCISFTHYCFCWWFSF